MEFSDPKQDVIDFRLTPYGERKLRDGKYNPTYYAFFDDGIIYDTAYTGDVTEEQNDIETRIFDETPRMKAIPRVAGPTVYKRMIDDGSGEGDYLRETELVGSIQSLGKCSSFLGQDSAPRWKLYSINGEFYSENILEKPLSESYEVVRMNIPQIPYNDVEYEWEALPPDTSNTSEVVDNVLQYTFEDGSSIKLNDNYILLDIQELGTDFDSSNFELTMYEVEEGSGLDGEQEKLKPLWFFKRPELVKDDILLDEEDVIEYDEDIILSDESLVDYYLDITMDGDIPDNMICDYLNKDNDNNNIYLRDGGIMSLDGGTRKCKSSDKKEVNNQYTVRREDDLGNEC